MEEKDCLQQGEEGRGQHSEEGQVAPSVPAATKKSYQIREKLCYFGAYFGAASFGPFLSLVFKGKGYSTLAIGILGAAGPFFYIFLLPPLSYFADRTGTAVHISVIGSAISVFLAFFLISLDDRILLGVVSVINAAACMPLYPTIDRRVMDSLGQEHQDDYGFQRLAASIGWGLGAPFGSVLVDQFERVYAIIPLAFGLSLASVALMSIKAKMSKADTNYKVVIGLIIHSPECLLCFAMMCLRGITQAALLGYAFLFMKDLGASETLMGLSLTVGTVVEVIMFFSAKQIQSRVKDTFLFVFSTCTVATWAILFSLIGAPWLSLPLALIDGLGFALVWVAAVQFFARHFPPELTNTAFACLHTAYVGVGPMIGSVIGGYLYDVIGPRTLFRSIGGLMFLTAFLYYVLHRMIVRRKQDDKKPLLCEANKQTSEEAGTPTEDEQAVADSGDDSHKSLNQ